MQKVVGRFAPTPSGGMHLGNLMCMLLAWLSARRADGRVVLRIEDLDPARSQIEYTRQLEKDLAVLGLDWDEGGLTDGCYGPYCQSQRGGYYQEQLDKLEAMGLVYPCFCSRAELHAANAPHASDGEPIYSGKCSRLTPEEVKIAREKRSPAMRLRVPDKPIIFVDGHYGPVTQNLAQACGDFILRRSDGVFAYQLAVVADDGAMGVTEVVRGRDLLSSTARQLYLYELLGLEPPTFAHTPLLLDPEGRRLSKRDQDVALPALLGAGLTPAGITGRLAYCAGLLDSPQALSPRQLIPYFDWAKVPKEDVCLPEGLFGARFPGE